MTLPYPIDRAVWLASVIARAVVMTAVAGTVLVAVETAKEIVRHV